MNYLQRTENGTVFAGTDVDILRATTIATALRLYAATGLKADRTYTPTAMLKAATEITGRKFKRGQYYEAWAALHTWIELAKAAPRR